MAPKTAKSARSCSALMSAGRFATNTTRRPGAQERKKKFGTKKEKYRRKKYNIKYCAGPGEWLRGASACRSGCPGWWRWPATATIWGYGYIVSDTMCLHLLSSHGQGSLPAQQLENKEHAKRPCWAVGNVAVLQKKGISRSRRLFEKKTVQASTPSTPEAPTNPRRCCVVSCQSVGAELDVAVQTNGLHCFGNNLASWWVTKCEKPSTDLKWQRGGIEEVGRAKKLLKREKKVNGLRSTSEAFAAEYNAVLPSKSP